MKHFFTILAALLGFISCNRNFTSAEREVIFRGDGDVMQVMSIANQSDSLLLRSRSQLVSEDMVATEEFKTLCSRMLATVQSPEHDGVGIAAPQVGILRQMVAVHHLSFLSILRLRLSSVKRSREVKVVCRCPIGVARWNVFRR